ncbi:MAG TPA: DNA replication and repair protein RecF [Thermoanaerobaculia bacterium]|nr:DNA replication and repair protein RecF [Thermoanaerobaculia bacterium]
MEILSLSTDGFRNLANGRVELHPRVNLIVGDNGQGKTNLLEALALVSGRPSFRTNDLSETRQHLAARTVVSVRLRDEGGDPRNVTTLGFVHASGAREQYRDGRRVTRLTAARSLPAVFLTAHDLSRLSGPPAERRRALDRAALALKPEHARALLAYERARAAKTRLLSLGARFDADELAVYETALAEAGGLVAVTRREARASLEREIARHADDLGTPFRNISLELVSDLPASGDAREMGRALEALLRSRKSEERRAQRCLVGPHRDDLVLRADGVAVASRASSGETRTFLLAWTLAEMSLLAGGEKRAPLLGFDDFDSEWDPRVLGAFAEALPEEGQVCLTSARPEAVRGLPLPAGAIYRMSAGRLAREGILGAGRSPENLAVAGGPR